MSKRRVSIPDDCSVVLPMVKLEVVYGLDEDGVQTIYRRWADGDGEDTVDHLTKVGLAAFLQQTLTVDMMEDLADDGWDDDDE